MFFTRKDKIVATKRNGFLALLRCCFYPNVQKVIEPSKSLPVLSVRQPPKPEQTLPVEPTEIVSVSQPVPLPLPPFDKPVEVPNLLGAQLRAPPLPLPKNNSPIQMYTVALCVTILSLLVHLYNQTQ